MKRHLSVWGTLIGLVAFAAERPELTAYPFKENVAAAGTYVAASAGMDFVVSGAIEGDVTVTATAACRVTLSDATVNGRLTVTGDAQLWLEGTSSLATDAATAIAVSGTLTVGGTGSLAASAAGGKKVGVIDAAGLVLAGGETTLTITGDTKNACGVSLAGDYTQLAGKLSVVATGAKKQNGVFLSKKKTAAIISGGMLSCTLAGEKSVGLALDKATSTGMMTGGRLWFVMTGAGAKGVKGDGTFTMTDGVLYASLSGGVAEDYYEYEDDDGNVWNYTVTLTSATKTSGGTKTYSTTSLIKAGTYPVMDPSKCYAVKVGTLNVSGGMVHVRATGTAGRGLGADSMNLSGGFFDIAVSGGPTDVYVEMLDEEAKTTCLDSDGAACLKTGDENGTLAITGGRFELVATGNAGKLVNAAGTLVIGTEGQSTLPTDAAFSPDIQGRTTGQKVFCSAYKQKAYGSLATATAVAESDMAGLSLAVAGNNRVSSSSGGMDDSADYSNPKGVKGVAGVTMHGGRLRVSTANDGGEGLESKALLTVNGGVLELVCADDCVNSGGNLVVNGGYIYAGSTGNDALDSNGNVYVNGGVVLAFTATTPEVGIDTDNSKGLIINGGYVVAVGSASNMAYGSSGTQSSYLNTSASASTYAGKYMVLSGTRTVYVKVPSMSSSSGSLSLMCSMPGLSSSAPAAVSSVPSGTTALGFHGIFYK